MELLNNIFDMHNMIILATFFLIVIFYKLDFDDNFSDNKINEKIVCSYVLLFLLKMLNKLSFFNTIFIFVIVSFFFLEFFYKDDFAKKMMKESRYYFFDYLFTIIFNYSFFVFFISLFLVSNFFIKFMMKINIIPYWIENKLSFLIKIIPHDSKKYVFYFIGACFLMYGIKNIFNNKFKTKNFKEIFRHMESILPFSEFIMNDSIKNLSEILIRKEDKTYFVRKNTYNLISLDYIKYKYIEFKYNHYKKVFELRIFGNIVCSMLIFINLSRRLKKNLLKLSKNIYMLIFKNKKINDIFVGHATLEMQLIRTIALNDGYSMTFRRKVYEYVYSTIFFHSLKDYYGYFQYSNYKYYKYYLIYIYTNVAPVRINGKNYQNIYHLYNSKDKSKDKKINFTNEQIYIWSLGLSHRYIDLSLLENIPDYVSKSKLKRLMKNMKLI